jgi:hypothetical protein
MPLRYLLVEEVVDDGPLYVLARHSSAIGSGESLSWDETPEYSEADELYRCDGRAAMSVRDRLPNRMVAHVGSPEGAPYGTVHGERGTTAGSLAYLYVTAGSSSTLLVGGPAAVEAAGQTSERISDLLQNPEGQAVAPTDLSILPLYENHTAAAQFVWSRLSNREILKTTTLEESGGRQMHVELGRVPGLIYLYWANTFDQRQIVIVAESRATVLEQYYQEFLDGR